MQHVNGYSAKLGYAITFVANADGNGDDNATIIEFYVPEKFRRQGGKWIPPEQRGKIIPFFRTGIRSQHEMKAWAQPHAPADPLLLKAIRERQGTEEFTFLL